MLPPQQSRGDGLRRLSSRGLRSGDTLAVERWQAHQLRERKSSGTTRVEVRGIPFEVFRGVYNTGGDTELMLASVAVTSRQTFLEVGCGSGAISIHLALTARSGMGIDVNPVAVSNSRHNASVLGVRNVEFRQGDVFGDITDQFDVVLFNPPFTSHPVRDCVDRMFWDPSDQAKQTFFRGVRRRLCSSGRIYFGWADLASLDPKLPLRLAD